MLRHHFNSPNGLTLPNGDIAEHGLEGVRPRAPTTRAHADVAAEGSRRTAGPSLWVADPAHERAARGGALPRPTGSQLPTESGFRSGEERSHEATRQRLPVKRVP